MATVLEELNAEMAAVIQRVSPSLVQVGNGTGGFGAGVICHSDGLIVTNAHVVHKPRPEVRLPDGRTLPARVLAVDQERDLAALLINAGGLTAIEFGDSQATKPGQWVMALGHPWGVNGAVTAGAVIAAETDRSGRTDHGWLVASLLLRPGHSGGPMVDAEGRLVGINTMINGPEVGLAVPVGAVKEFLRQSLGSRVARAA